MKQLSKMKKDPKVVALVAAVPLTIGFTKEKFRQVRNNLDRNSTLEKLVAILQRITHFKQSIR